MKGLWITDLGSSCFHKADDGGHAGRNPLWITERALCSFG